MKFSSKFSASPNRKNKIGKKFKVRILGILIAIAAIVGFSNSSDDVRRAAPAQQPSIASTTPQTGNEILVDKVEIVKARVLSVEKEEVKIVGSTGIEGNFQTLRVRILEGSRANESVIVENDHIGLKVGEKFYLRHSTDALDGIEYYSVSEPYRLPQLGILSLIFVIAVFAFGGIQGIRGLLSLIGSLLLIVYVLLPGVLNGYSPILIATGVSSLIIVVGSYITHGFNRTTSSAVMGMIVTVICTGIMAVIAVKWTRLSGFGSEEVLYLNLNSGGSIDVIGLLLGGIMIGLLGVLYDVAIGQAISVEELLRIAPHVSKKKIYERAIRIGREHIGALVNTLAIAYVGASLPLLLLFYMSPIATIWTTANQEVFATEIVRTMIGSIGLVLAVPITTIISVWFLTKNTAKGGHKPGLETIESEEAALAKIEHAGHGHSHGGHGHHGHPADPDSRDDHMHV